MGSEARLGIEARKAHWKCAMRWRRAVEGALSGAGLTFTCNGKMFPCLSSNCSAGDVVLTIENGKATDPQVVS